MRYKVSSCETAKIAVLKDCYVITRDFTPVLSQPDWGSVLSTILYHSVGCLWSHLQWGVVDVARVLVLVVSWVAVVDTPAVITDTSDAHTVGIAEDRGHLS